jgi:hypothetical protein
MPNRSELVFEYDATSFVTSAHCSICGEKMPAPDVNLRQSADRVMRFAQQFLEHKNQRHASDAGRRFRGARVMDAFDTEQ